MSAQPPSTWWPRTNPRILELQQLLNDAASIAVLREGLGGMFDDSEERIVFLFDLASYAIVAKVAGTEHLKAEPPTAWFNTLGVEVVGRFGHVRGEGGVITVRVHRGDARGVAGAVSQISDMRAAKDFIRRNGYRIVK